MKKKIRKRLIICNTFYQLIMALHLKDTLFQCDLVSIVLTDQTRGMDVIAIKLKEIGKFNKVHYEETKILCSRKNKLCSKLNDILKIIKGDKKYRYLCVEEYDELIYYNPDIFTHILFANLYRQNNNICCSRYEEGILSYSNVFPLFSKLLWAQRIRKLLGWDNLDEHLKNFYCCYPENYNGLLDVKRVPIISQNSNVGNELISLFDAKIHSDEYKEKYIFFTSVYDYEGGEPIGEYEVVEKIARIVGKDNILIKQHPRDERTLYIEKGYKVDKNSSMPWEVIQLGYDFTDKILLTVNSGSVLSANLIMENGPIAFFVYKFCDLSRNEQAQVSANSIEKLLNNKKLQDEMRNVHIAKALEDILIV